MAYNVNVLRDSVNPLDDRLTTFEVTFPRIILAELNTHRMLSRNSASSRAIPTEESIQRVLDDPFVPKFNKRVKGMGYGRPLTYFEQMAAEGHWNAVKREACIQAGKLLDVDKARANRLLEPFMWQTAIVSATDWDNFYNLRTDPGAQPEFQKLARMMHTAHMLSHPTHLSWGEWHLPLVEFEDSMHLGTYSLAQCSAGRCARVSYDKQHNDESLIDSIGRWERLSGFAHWSPGEHPARVITEEEHEFMQYLYDAIESYPGAYDLAPPDPFYVGNFRGWVQLRKHYNNEAVFEGPVHHGHG